MQKIIAIFLLLSLASIGQAKLYSVVAVIAPGARYHLNDLYDGGQFKARWGQISSVGLRQQQSLGKAFKKDYIDNNAFLSKTFDKDEYQLITTNINRTIQSGLANLYGMYGLGNGQKMEPAQKKYRFPPYSSHEDISENVFSLPEGQLIKTVSFNSAFLQICPNQDKEIEKNIRAQFSDYNDMLLTYTPFLKKMGNVFGIDPSSMNFTRLSALYDTIRVDKYLGRSLPGQFSQQDWQNIDHLYNWYNQFTRSFNLSKAYNTFKFNQIISAFDGKVKSPNSKAKWITISANEIDIVSAQNGLGISSAQCIEELYRKGSTSALNCESGTPFSSSIIFELFSDNGADFYVKIRNNGKYVNLCGAKQISCSYESWKAQAKQATVADPLSVCGKSSIELTPEAKIVPSILLE